MNEKSPQEYRAWISLGSNIRPEHYLPAAVLALEFLGRVEQCSSVWQSSPVGEEDQADFCNAAVLLVTELTPVELKPSLRMVEGHLNRIRVPDHKNGPRTIDLDIAFFEDLVITSEELTIPDPEISARPFLAVPLAELTPDYCHPVTGETLSEIAIAAGGEASLIRRNDIVLTITEPATEDSTRFWDEEDESDDEE